MKDLDKMTEQEIAMMEQRGSRDERLEKLLAKYKNTGKANKL